MPQHQENSIVLSGNLIERAALRYTPARVPVVDFRVEHVSRQVEAGCERDVRCELSVRALGPLAHVVEALAIGSAMRLRGFLAARGLRSRTPVLHVNQIELLEGIENGFQT